MSLLGKQDFKMWVSEVHCIKIYVSWVHNVFKMWVSGVYIWKKCGSLGHSTTLKKKCGSLGLLGKSYSCNSWTFWRFEASSYFGGAIRINSWITNIRKIRIYSNFYISSKNKWLVCAIPVHSDSFSLGHVHSQHEPQRIAGTHISRRLSFTLAFMLFIVHYLYYSSCIPKKKASQSRRHRKPEKLHNAAIHL